MSSIALLVLFIALGLLSGAVTATVAKNTKHDRTVWFTVGTVAFLAIAVLLVVALGSMNFD